MVWISLCEAATIHSLWAMDDYKEKLGTVDCIFISTCTYSNCVYVTGSGKTRHQRRLDIVLYIMKEFLELGNETLPVSLC